MKVFAAALAASLLGLPLIGNADPTPIKSVLVTQRFTLAEPYVDTWSLDRAKVSAGTLAVLDVDPKLVARRESLAPVLYVGGKPTMRLNHGDASGHVLVIVPAGVDINKSQIWFGAPAAAESLSAAKISAEQARAGRSLATRASQRPTERPAVAAKDLAALLRDAAAPLIDEFSPQDRDVAAMWRLPEGG